MFHPKCAEDWQDKFGSTLFVDNAHTHTLKWQCVVCQTAIDIDTDAQITEQSLKCDNCKELQPNPAYAAQSLLNLHKILLRHIKI